VRIAVTDPNLDLRGAGPDAVCIISRLVLLVGNFAGRPNVSQMEGQSGDDQRGLTMNLEA